MPRPSISLKARALRYISMREHSRLELSRKLQRYAQEGDNVAALLDWLEGAQFLSQQRFSESLVHRRATRFGNNRIVSELHSHGIQGEELTHAKATLKVDEVQRARVVLLKKFSQPPNDSTERAKRIRFLQQRGFSHNAIRTAMNYRSDTGDGGDDEGNNYVSDDADEQASSTAVELDDMESNFDSEIDDIGDAQNLSFNGRRADTD